MKVIGQLFWQGNLILMGILSILFLIVLVMIGYRASQIFGSSVSHATTFRHQLTHIKEVGLFTAVLSIFFQFLGLHQEFSFFGRMYQAFPSSMIYTGFLLTIIPLIYGLIIFLISYIGWFVLEKAMRV